MKLRLKQLNQNSALICDYIARYHEQHRKSPTLQEIADGCHMDRITVIHHVAALVAHGCLIQERGDYRAKKRGLRVADPEWRPSNECAKIGES